MMKRQVLSRQQVVALHKRLENVLTKGDDNLWSYPAGIDDSTLAAEFKASVAAVGNLRVELFGKVRARSPDARSEAIYAQVVELQQRVDGLEQQLKALTAYCEEIRDKHDRLSDNLSINRVADVRHLKLNHSINGVRPNA